MSNWLMNTMKNGVNGVSDPRITYYFYRQVQGVPGFDGYEADEEVLECGLPGYFNPYPAGEVFCSPGGGYWGRDHGMIMVFHQMVSKEHFMEYIQLEVNTMIVVMLHRKMELEQEVLELHQ
jgi:hypothetical protein